MVAIGLQEADPDLIGVVEAEHVLIAVDPGIVGDLHVGVERPQTSTQAKREGAVAFRPEAALNEGFIAPLRRLGVQPNRLGDAAGYEARFTGLGGEAIEEFGLAVEQGRDVLGNALLIVGLPLHDGFLHPVEQRERHPRHEDQCQGQTHQHELRRQTQAPDAPGTLPR